MKRFVSYLVPLLVVTVVAHADSASAPIPANVQLPACLSNARNMLRCPKDSVLLVLEGTALCRKPMRLGDPLLREGPAIRTHDENPRMLEWVGRYHDNDKTGRSFDFYETGELEYIRDWKNDDYHGAYIECYKSGRVRGISFRVNGTLQGLARWWREDGKLTSATDYVNGDSVRNIHDRSEAELKRLSKPPENVCRPRVCDIYASPQFRM